MYLQTIVKSTCKCILNINCWQTYLYIYIMYMYKCIGLGFDDSVNNMKYFTVGERLDFQLFLSCQQWLALTSGDGDVPLNPIMAGIHGIRSIIFKAAKLVAADYFLDRLWENKTTTWRTPKSLWRKSRTGGSTRTETRVILCLCPVSVYHNRWLSKSLIRDLRKQPVGRKDHGLRKRLDTGVILFWHLPVLNYFMYKGHFYKQKYGATDRLLSPTYIVANLYNTVVPLLVATLNRGHPL